MDYSNARNKQEIKDQISKIEYAVGRGVSHRYTAPPADVVEAIKKAGLYYLMPKNPYTTSDLEITGTWAAVLQAAAEQGSPLREALDDASTMYVYDAIQFSLSPSQKILVEKLAGGATKVAQTIYMRESGMVQVDCNEHRTGIPDQLGDYNEGIVSFPHTHGGKYAISEFKSWINKICPPEIFDAPAPGKEASCYTAVRFVNDHKWAGRYAAIAGNVVSDGHHPMRGYWSTVADMYVYGVYPTYTEALEAAKAGRIKGTYSGNPQTTLARAQRAIEMLCQKIGTRRHGDMARADLARLYRFRASKELAQARIERRFTEIELNEQWLMAKKSDWAIMNAARREGNPAAEITRLGSIVAKDGMLHAALKGAGKPFNPVDWMPE